MTGASSSILDGQRVLDVHFGEKLQARRRMDGAKVSQEELGAALDITFPQIQKYENGRNRVSAALMVRIAHT
jgi:transcriptional regulator with XRE-family HTH domain